MVVAFPPRISLIWAALHSLEPAITTRPSTGRTAASFGPAITVFEKYYSPYYLNKDDVIDLNDLTYALQFLGAKAGDSNWAKAVPVDYNEDSEIDIQDPVLILTNYSVILQLKQSRAM